MMCAFWNYWIASFGVVAIFVISGIFGDIPCTAPSGLNKICLCKNPPQGLWLSCEPIPQKGFKSDLDYLGANIPDEAFYLAIRNLYYNTTIRHYQFNSTSLKTLRIENGKFVKIERNAFKGLKNLQHMELIGSSQLKSVPENLVGGCPHLVTLKLTGSNISEINKHVVGAGMNLRHLTLESLNLKSIDDGLFSDSKHLEFLDLSNNDIELIDQEKFSSIHMLKHVNLSNNHNMTFGPSPFTYLPMMKTLRLAGLFQKTKIPEGLFFGIHNLSLLDLSSNSLAEFPSDYIEPFSPNLNELILDNNHFPSLDQNFHSLVNLRTLSMVNSGIQKIVKNEFLGLEKLRTLNLKENNISSIEDYAFRHLVSLLTLDLSRNGLAFLGDRSLRGLFSLKRLDLTRNQLRTFSPDMLNSIPTADIRIGGGAFDAQGYWRLYNPMDCNCTILATKRWLQDQQKTVGITCQKPEAFRGKKLANISEKQFTQCSDPSIEGCCSKSVDVEIGSTASITCDVTGYPRPKVEFHIVLGDPFPPDRTEYSNNGTEIILSKFQSSDAKVVECKASNVLGSEKMTIFIETAPATSYRTEYMITGIFIALLLVVVTVVAGAWYLKKRRGRRGFESETLTDGSVQYSSLYRNV